MDNTNTYFGKFTITSCDDVQFEKIKEYIAQFELDDRELKEKDFLIAVSGDELLGFGRILEYADCSELCSLGVVEPYRIKLRSTTI